MHKLKLFNSMSNKKEEFIPIDSNNIRIYACGPTVYNYAHIGNARMAVVFDFLVRLLRHMYPNVTYVSNITDIDDKIIAKSIQENIPYEKITNKFTKIYNEDMSELNVLKPDKQPRATEYIKSMIKKVQNLEQQGYAYESQNHVLFRVKSFPKYGALSKRDKMKQVAGSRVEIAEYKENPADFILWKPSKNNEPGWPSPWGRGRPGWHTECFAMSEELLNMPFDIHGGGMDLKFPHHENEIAQACCYANKIDDATSYAKYWLHNGFVTVQDEKMSKSLHNFLLIRDCLKKYDAEVIRLSLLSSHYRSPLSWNENLLEQSKSILIKFYKFLMANSQVKVDKIENIQLPDQIKEALFDDLNLAKVFSHLNAILASEKTCSNRDSVKKTKETILKTASIIGILQKKPSDWLESRKPKLNNEEMIKNLIKERNILRKNKKFDKADKIRDKLLDLGIKLNDT